jgi:CBS domain containing-hemolysin-like protein
LLTALGIAAVVALVLANAYFVAGEFAFVAARRSRLVDAQEHGDARAGRALEVLGRLSFMLSGAQLGITVSSLVVGFVAEPTLGAALEPVVGWTGVSETARGGIALTLGFIIATATQMVIGELAPKNLAIARPEPMALALARSTLLYLKISRPVIRLFDGAANGLLRRVGIEPVEELHGGVHADELPLIVDASSAAGSLTETQADLLRRALEFRDLDAREVMVPWNRVVSVSAGGTGSDLQGLLGTTRHMRFPIVDEVGEVVGMVHAKDLLGVPVERRADVAIADLSRPVLAVPESADLHRVLAELRESASPMAIVVDEHGGTAGVLTIEDLVEELVGDIDDEFDIVDVGGPVALAADHWRLPGDLRLHEVERETGVEVPEGPYDTVAGFAMDQLGRIPEVGDAVQAAGLEVRIVEMDERRVVTVELLIRPATEESDDGQSAP